MLMFKQQLNNYTEEAIQQVIDQAIGKPCIDQNGDIIGYIESAEKVEQTVLEFKVREI
jgi:hypothetical protein